MESQTNIGDQNTQKIGQNPMNPLPQIPEKTKVNFWVITTIFLFVILVVGGLFVFLSAKKQNQTMSTQNSLPKSTTSTPTITKESVFPVKIFGATVDTKNVNPVKGDPAPCQPDFFDPKISKFSKVKQNGTPSELYKIQGFQDDLDGGVMMIDGWYKEGENKVNLPLPFKVTVYNFGCASSFSNVLDLSKNNVRQALYTHVLHYSFSSDGKYLFLVNNINNQGNWTLYKRIINIETNEISEVPNMECVSELDGFWQGERLLTYTERADKHDYQTDICVWDKSARLVSRVGANTAWGAASRDFLAEKIGLLPNEPDIFYAYTSRDDNTCSLFLADITKNDSLKTIDILDKRNYSQSYYCASPEVEFDFSNLSIEHGTLKYRIEKDRQSSGQTIWNEWQTTLLK